ncbi:MAG TPA: cysteine--tRNA ligase [Bdellovibrionota bacterium]|jgi:cysteinyl-tRNA synthetase
MAKDVLLFNTRTRKKEKFVPLRGEDAGLYTCGPTVYHYAHIGNLRTYVFEDLLVRTLQRAGYKLTHVMNITDVGHLVSDGDDGEDKMEVGARRAGKTIWEIADYYTKVFFDDLTKLNCRKPQIVPKATEHVPEMIALIEKLEKKGIAYKTSDGMYYDTAKFPSYPDFAKLDVENLEAGKRVAVGEKRNPTDFALWKFLPKDKKRQQEWDSPWGKGFPGWHIECSAMAMKYLGETFDIHCGGIDHIPVHHTNEIAQSEAATGKRYVNLWMHGEFLNEDSGKMSKSKGETLTLAVVERDGFAPMDYRFLLLQTHYRASLRFSYDSLKAAQSGYRGLVERLKEIHSAGGSVTKESKAAEVHATEFERAVFDDLNLPQAMAVLFGALKSADLGPAEKLALAYDFDEVLGLKLKEAVEHEETISPDVQALVHARDEARKNKQWAESDRLRGELVAKGYAVEDTPKGTKVKKA